MLHPKREDKYRALLFSGKACLREDSFSFMKYLNYLILLTLHKLQENNNM